MSQRSPLTVRQLIQELERFPGDWYVHAEGGDCNCEEVLAVEHWTDVIGFSDPDAKAVLLRSTDVPQDRLT